MGTFQHHAIIVTTFDYGLSLDAKNQAVQLELGVTDIHKSSVNGVHTFVIMPDGSKEGWSGSEDGDKARQSFIEWVLSKSYENGSNPFHWVEVGYGERGVSVRHEFENVTRWL